MAKKESANKELAWGRTPMGEFFIAVTVTAQDGKGQVVTIPEDVFIFSAEEEEKLWAYKSKLTIAKALPRSDRGNGKEATQLFPAKGD